MGAKILKFSMDEQEYKLSVYPDRVEEAVPEVDVSDEQLLQVITSGSDLLLPMTVKHQTDVYQLTYEINQGLLFYAQIINHLTDLDRIRLGINLLDLLQLKETAFIPVVNPNNLVFDINLKPHVIHRGIEGVLKPADSLQVSLFDQIKALVISTIYPQYKFDKLYNGVLRSNILHGKLLKELAKSDDPEFVRDQLLSLYHKEKEKFTNNQKVITKKKWSVYQKGFWSLVVATLVLAVVTGYWLIIKLPVDNKLNASTNAYLSTNYDKVIEDLERVPIIQIPKANKLMLAQSYIHVENLNHVQKDNILNSLGINSDDHYMDYWIHTGRGDFSKALDTARFIGDNQLILYSYTKLYTAANNNPKLTGSKKQKLLRSYKKQINNYSKKLQKDHKNEK